MLNLQLTSQISIHKIWCLASENKKLKVKSLVVLFSG